MDVVLDFMAAGIARTTPKFTAVESAGTRLSGPSAAGNFDSALKLELLRKGMLSKGTPACPHTYTEERHHDAYERSYVRVSVLKVQLQVIWIERLTSVHSTQLNRAC